LSSTGGREAGGLLAATSLCDCPFAGIAAAKMAKTKSMKKE